MGPSLTCSPLLTLCILPGGTLNYGLKEHRDWHRRQRRTDSESRTRRPLYTSALYVCCFDAVLPRGSFKESRCTLCNECTCVRTPSERVVSLGGLTTSMIYANLNERLQASPTPLPVTNRGIKKAERTPL
ncbi:hypothetical protein DFH06DRAFT_1229098, partial [Mycena polygramma]